ncbi:dnaJ homolog subfamily C member 4-like [Asterias amurensis]|uniref:dnaJ homolog subfamily C member 4-like n=1 Tax=Asterias amurensis TaxID=7602 RepID=UPI003AB50DCC
MEKTFVMCLQRQRYLGQFITRSFSSQTPSLLQKNYYEVLGVKRNANASEVKAAYINLSKTLHPDVNPKNENPHASFVELNQAYAVLSKSLSRRDYDSSLNNPPGTRRVNRHSRKATPGDPYGTQQQSHDWYNDMGTFYRGKPSDTAENYYGIKGIRRVSSGYILFGCIVFLCAGALMHYIIFKQSSSYALKRLDAKDRQISIIYNEAKSRAMQNGNKKQMELLRARQDELSNKKDSLSGKML